ncbi:MAG: bifunctional DNA-formamidopyrimidine glycosylase/DNA-(apurinic or apyrimidinic site) lyase, partial [Stenotrophobium sp.]
RRGIAPHVLGRKIVGVTVRDARLRWPVAPDLGAKISGQKITGTSRRGKYLLLEFASGDRLIIHLGMTGRLLVLKPGTALRKHDHVDIELGGKILLRFHDPRRFGAVLLWPANETTHPLLENLGPEPFSEAFNGDYLFALSRSRSAAVKNFIMDGHVVVGAGNIYAAEALFRAGIRPVKAAGRLTRGQYTVLAEKIREVLAEAVKQGGTTLRDFAGADGAPGYFQQKLFVYGREGEPCLICKTPIKCVTIGQRSSFYCSRCQR